MITIIKSTIGNNEQYELHLGQYIKRLNAQKMAKFVDKPITCPEHLFEIFKSDLKMYVEKE